MGEGFMKIGEIAGFCGVSVKTVRVYEQKGLLKPARIDEATGYRYYSAEQVQQLYALIELKLLGFSLAEIKKLLDGGMSGEQFMEALVHKKAAWQEQVDKAEYKVNAIERITERMSGADTAVPMHELSEEERAWLLAKMVCVEDMSGRRIISEAIWL